jgi:hypothetical protein
MLSVSYLTFLLSVHVDKGARFQVVEGFGCAAGTAGGGIDTLRPLFYLWTIVLPLVSTLFYSRKSLHPGGFI